MLRSALGFPIKTENISIIKKISISVKQSLGGHMLLEHFRTNHLKTTNSAWVKLSPGVTLLTSWDLHWLRIGLRLSEVRFWDSVLNFLDKSFPGMPGRTN